jgi:hypothetical protein
MRVAGAAPRFARRIGHTGTVFLERVQETARLREELACGLHTTPNDPKD